MSLKKRTCNKRLQWRLQKIINAFVILSTFSINKPRVKCGQNVVEINNKNTVNTWALFLQGLFCSNSLENFADCCTMHIAVVAVIEHLIIRCSDGS